MANKIYKRNTTQQDYNGTVSISDLNKLPNLGELTPTVDAGSGGDTDLSVTSDATTVTIESSTGDSATITAVDSSDAGVMTPALLLNLQRLITLSGVAADEPDLGTFTGTTIPDDSDIKEALQALETSVEAVSAGSITEYSAGNGARVIATGAGITFSKSGGTGTFVIPSGVTPLSAVINSGTAADLDGSNNFKTVFNFTGTSNNTNVTNFNPPNIQVINTTGPVVGNSNIPSDTFPAVYDEGASPQRQVVLTGSGDITTRVLGLDVFTNWTLKFNF